MKKQIIDRLIDMDFSKEEACEIADLHEKIVNEMNEGVSTFKFLKKDGTTRVAHGTLKDVEEFIVGDSSKKRERDIMLQVFFDVDINAWRSFKIQNLIE